MANPTIKHFVISKLFPMQRQGYPYSILDVDFLSKQLPLAKNMLSSLENQTNKNFELVFLTNPKFFEDKKYEFIFSTLQNSTALPLRFVKFRRYTIFGKDKSGSWKFNRDLQEKQNPEWFDILKAARNGYDFVITTAMDFDDFVFKGAVKEAQDKVSQCESVLAYGYNNGYTYIQGDLYHWPYFWCKGRAHLGIFQSLILKSSAVKELPCFFVQDFWHDVIKPQLKVFLTAYGMEFSENMFQYDISRMAYIYLRHEFSQQQLVAHKGEPFKIKNRKFTTADITKKQLEEEFGFTGYELKSIE